MKEQLAEIQRKLEWVWEIACEGGVQSSDIEEIQYLVKQVVETVDDWQPGQPLPGWSLRRS